MIVTPDGATLPLPIDLAWPIWPIRRSSYLGIRAHPKSLRQIRPLLGVKPLEPAGKALRSSIDSNSREPLDLDLLRLEAEQRTPRKCRACGGRMVETYQTPRPTVAELIRMPPSMG